MNQQTPPSLWLNLGLGFSGLLTLILLVSLLLRLFSPRFENKREGDSFLIQEVIQVEVLNGAGAPGLASRFTNVLRKSGFDVVETGNFEHYNVLQSYIISRTDTKENAERIARALGIKQENVIILASNDYFLDATIVIGQDWKDLYTE